MEARLIPEHLHCLTEGGSPPLPSPRQTALTWLLTWATIRPRVDWLPDRVPASAAINAPRCLLSEATLASPRDRILVGQLSLLPLCLQGNARLSSLLELGRCLVLLIGPCCDRASDPRAGLFLSAGLMPMQSADCQPVLACRGHSRPVKLRTDPMHLTGLSVERALPKKIFPRCQR